MFEHKKLGDFYDVEDLQKLRLHLQSFQKQVNENKQYCHSYPTEHYDEVTNIHNELQALSRTDDALNVLINEIDDTLGYMEVKNAN